MLQIEEVCNELQNLNCSKACGPDLLPARLLRMSAEFIAPSLARLGKQNSSLDFKYTYQQS